MIGSNIDVCIDRSLVIGSKIGVRDRTFEWKDAECAFWRIREPSYIGVYKPVHRPSIIRILTAALTISSAEQE